jgi:hypothetical protein
MKSGSEEDTMTTRGQATEEVPITTGAPADLVMVAILTATTGAMARTDTGDSRRQHLKKWQGVALSIVLSAFSCRKPGRGEAKSRNDI